MKTILITLGILVIGGGIVFATTRTTTAPTDLTNTPTATESLVDTPTASATYQANGFRFDPIDYTVTPLDRGYLLENGRYTLVVALFPDPIGGGTGYFDLPATPAELVPYTITTDGIIVDGALAPASDTTSCCGHTLYEVLDTESNTAWVYVYGDQVAFVSSNSPTPTPSDLARDLRVIAASIDFN